MTAMATVTRDEATLVSSLARPDAYPGHVASVLVAETHVSYLFFTDRKIVAERWA